MNKDVHNSTVSKHSNIMALDIHPDISEDLLMIIAMLQSPSHCCDTMQPSRQI